MMDALFMIGLSLFACVGLVQTVSWIAIRLGSHRGKVVRVFPIGGAGANPGDQMAQMYACLQWEANPSRQIFVLYDMGLTEKDVCSCRQLAEGAGVGFVRNMQELEHLLAKKDQDNIF